MEVYRYYENVTNERVRRSEAEFKRSVNLEYINAGLQRSKKMPPLKSLFTPKKRSASYEEAKGLFAGKPVFKQINKEE